MNEKGHSDEYTECPFFQRRLAEIRRPSFVREDVLYLPTETCPHLRARSVSRKVAHQPLMYGIHRLSAPFHRGTTEEHNMFRYIFRLQAQDFALAAIPAAVKQNIYLLHEISPEFVRIRVSRIHKFVDAGQFYFVILFQLDIENGPRLRHYPPHRGRSRTAAARGLRSLLFFLFGNGSRRSGCGVCRGLLVYVVFPIIVFIILNTPFTEGLKLCCIPCPSVCRSSGLSLSTLQRFANFHPIHGEQNKGRFYSPFANYR